MSLVPFSRLRDVNLRVHRLPFVLSCYLVLDCAGRWNKLRQDGICTNTTLTRLGGTDFKAVNAVVDATHRYREIFYGDGER